MASEVYQVFPILSVRDLQEAIAFYTQRLGFELAWSWGNPPVRAGVRQGAVEFQLVCDPAVPPSGPSTVYCHMRGVDEYYTACRERGAHVVRHLGDRPWGARDFQLADPSANRIGFAEVFDRTGD
jgi:uncharacterized glyoxalase superfamily protein PhnB